MGIAKCRSCWHVKRRRVVTFADGLAGEDLFAIVVPVAVGVEVDPGVELGAAGGALHVDHDGGVSFADHQVTESHAVFIGGAGGVVAIGIGRRLAPRVGPVAVCRAPLSAMVVG